MALFSQKDIQLLQIGGIATKTTGTIEAMNAGEIGIFTPAGVRLTEATAATAKQFIIVKKTSGGIPLVTDTIDKTTIKFAKATLYTASQEQITTIGYNGTSGSLQAINDNKYHVRISLRQGLTSNHGGLYLKHGYYTSDATATEFEVAKNLLLDLSNEFSKEADRPVIATMLCNNAGAALGVGPSTLSVNYGSRYILASDTTHTLVAGDVVRIGGTATTTPVYVVKSVSGATIELESRYLGASATGVAGEVITAALAAAASFGIVLTGAAAGYRVGRLDQDLSVNSFDVTLENFGTSTFGLTQQAKPGTGTEKQIKALEFFLQGNEGDYLRLGEPNIFAPRAEASGVYDMIDIFVEEIYTGSMVASPIRKHYTLAIPQATPNYALTGTADDITDVLEVLAFGSVNGNLTV